MILLAVLVLYEAFAILLFLLILSKRACAFSDVRCGFPISVLKSVFNDDPEMLQVRASHLGCFLCFYLPPFI